jgi:hypothetical protein
MARDGLVVGVGGIGIAIARRWDAGAADHSTVGEVAAVVGGDPVGSAGFLIVYC